MPLTNVTVSPQYADDVILATSTTGGLFELEEACTSQIYTLRKDGFVTRDVTFDAATTNISMTTQG